MGKSGVIVGETNGKVEASCLDKRDHDKPTVSKLGSSAFNDSNDVFKIEKGMAVKAIGGRGASAKILDGGIAKSGEGCGSVCKAVLRSKLDFNCSDSNRSSVIRLMIVWFPWVFGSDDGISGGVAVSGDQTVYINFEKDKGSIGSALCPVGDVLSGPAIDLYVDLGDFEPFFGNEKMGDDVVSLSSSARRRGKKNFFPSKIHRMKTRSGVSGLEVELADRLASGKKDVKVIAATENFSSANKLGGGGFGPVFKGQLANGQEVAIKRLSNNSGQGAVELAVDAQRNAKPCVFTTCGEEMRRGIKGRRNNSSVKLIAATENFSSANKLGRGGFGPVFKGQLANGQEIAVKRLSNDSGQDFGTARIVGGDEIQENTKRVVGTFGYMSPEYVLGGLFSVKSDVFSFGVILLEIVSGKKNWGFYHESSSSNLLKYIWELWRDTKALEVVDSCISNSCPVHDEVLRVESGGGVVDSGGGVLVGG
ncbi:hypothetical protein LWI29_005991 [Acer saccharum]|uniref:Protein kinase domain-containing protein n=1 Tax=Acer saccharum TaxID=4024 RepID=A0AA39W229_ACESA|nr:hypothetical protein LWI29_005991 [Acer saccharum]